MNPLPQTHHQKLVEVANTLSEWVDEEFEQDASGTSPLYKLWREIADHLLYYDTLTKLN